MTRLRLIAKLAEHAARHHGGLRLVDASTGHTSMGPLNDNDNAVRLQLRFQGVGDLRCHFFLNLETLGKSIYDASDL